MLRKICCLHTDLCKCHCFGLTRNKNVKLGYIAIIFFFVPAIVLLNSITDTQRKQTIIDFNCLIDPQNSAVLELQSACVRDKNSQVVFLSLCTMHLILFGLMFLQSDKVKIINQGGWLFKLVFVCLFIFLWRLCAGTRLFQWLCIGSAWLSSVVYLFEGLVLVDLVYSLDWTFDEHSRDNGKCHIFKVVVTLLGLAGAGVLVYFSFVHNQLWVSWSNLAFLGVFLIIALLRIFRQNSILIAVFTSVLFIVFSFYLQGHIAHNTILLIIRGIFLSILLLGMLAQGSNMIRTPKSSINELLALNTTPNEQDNRYVSSNKWTIYHLIMTVILLGIPGCFCWQEEGSYLLVDTAIGVSEWVAWTGCALWYIWSLLAMKIFPSEDFSELENYFRQYELK